MDHGDLSPETLVYYSNLAWKYDMEVRPYPEESVTFGRIIEPQVTAVFTSRHRGKHTIPQSVPILSWNKQWETLEIAPLIRWNEPMILEKMKKDNILYAKRASS